MPHRTTWKNTTVIRKQKMAAREMLKAMAFIGVSIGKAREG